MLDQREVLLPLPVLAGRENLNTSNYLRKALSLAVKAFIAISLMVIVLGEGLLTFVLFTDTKPGEGILEPWTWYVMVYSYIGFWIILAYKLTPILFPKYQPDSNLSG
jgi:hypothetical protein